ncbi:FAD-dependent oxidoreductase [Brucella cytisi]|uniref:FAD-dependent oxidoreductase n=1 Tax=Brucella cytisi TaxID=407152 RepID=UPI0035BC2291
MSHLLSTDTTAVDTIIIGGGPAGCWAAWKAREVGASVILIDKGYVGTSGAMAAGNNTIIDTARGTKERDATVAQRLKRGLGLVHRSVVEEVLDQTRSNLDLLAEWGYPFPAYEDGRPYRGMLRGPDFLRFMRQRLIKAGVRILDHHPAEELLLTNDGAVAGVRARSRRSGGLTDLRSGAVIVASGGCAFLSGGLGTNNLTGDGYLLAAEAGATFSSMEFSSQYGISPVFSSVTKGVVYFWATFSDAAGNEIDLHGDRQSVAKFLLKGSVYAVLDKASPRLQEGFRKGQPNIFVPFDRMGIDPFKDRFPITLRHEGTVRGSGGIITDKTAATSIPGLFAAGDAASRVSMSGATSGGGGPNAAWAIATGSWAGENAAAFAQNIGSQHHERRVRPGRSGLSKAEGPSRAKEIADVIQRIKAETLPLDKGFFRTAESLIANETVLSDLWRDDQWRRSGDPYDLARIREAEALIATSRWVATSALLRNESRGVHRRTDRPEMDPSLAIQVHSGGLDKPWANYAFEQQEVSIAS